MPHNADEHIRSFELALDGEEKNLGVLGRTIGLELLSRTVQRTPVDNGVLRNNWNLSLGSPDESTTEEPDKTGQAAINRGAGAISGFRWGENMWLTNNQPYAPVWEYGTFVPPDPGPSNDPRPDRKGKILVSGGFSLQAPAGMLGVTEQEIAQAFGT